MEELMKARVDVFKNAAIELLAKIEREKTRDDKITFLAGFLEGFMLKKEELQKRVFA